MTEPICRGCLHPGAAHILYSGCSQCDCRAWSLTGWAWSPPQHQAIGERPMTALPEGTHLAYIVTHEAWYARTPGVIDGRSITVQTSADGGGCAWEFVVDERTFSHDQTAIRVGVFDDAFDAFAQIPQFFATLAKEGVGSLSAVRDLLDEMGAADETDRVGPAGSREMGMRDRIALSLEGLLDQEDRARAADRVMRALGTDASQ